jgi:hypothetical protein
LPVLDRLPQGIQVVVSPESGLRPGRAAAIAETAAK